MSKADKKPKKGVKEKGSPKPEKGSPKKQTGLTEEDAWFRTGSDGFRQKQHDDAVALTKRERSAFRFYLKPDQEAVIVFVDSSPFFVYEHGFKTGNSFVNVTCTKGIRPCAICDAGGERSRSSYVAYLTCIDTREFVKKDGTKAKNVKVLYPAKGSTIKILEDLVKKRGDLSGLAFRVKRYVQKEQSCGSTLEFVKKIKLTGDNLKPLDYKKILAPPTDAELANLGYHYSVMGSDSDLNSISSVSAPDEEETASGLDSLL